MLDLLFDIHQSGQIQEAGAAAAGARSRADAVAERVSNLERRCEKLALGCQAMLELLRERGGPSDAEILARMEQIDTRDGSRDGRITPHVVACPKCGRQASNRRKTCLYCDTPLPNPVAFR